MNVSLLDASVFVFVSVSVAVSLYGFDSKKASGFVQIFGALAYSVAMRRLSILSHCCLDKLFCVEYSCYSLFQYKHLNTQSIAVRQSPGLLVPIGFYWHCSL
ncbi:hypothetical protein FVEG_15128 [Fusarium verticillioides 7600]|uniref:Uncharacterized protein n=1 Tax=Gibberella moniliformis (strain M3125 / FGSC 7600) TaxID=334819 RepID=W7LXY2_GIBM7|nr:hypothetical protein FVEG_15128 [Fusarium verticillioides 7600]EWG40355.1 hypothetical protein FVEG_15128 [Fusarium verticillioides 7600]